jgi:hypothetical protein
VIATSQRTAAAAMLLTQPTLGNAEDSSGLGAHIRQICIVTGPPSTYFAARSDRREYARLRCPGPITFREPRFADCRFLSPTRRGLPAPNRSGSGNAYRPVRGRGSYVCWKHQLP